MSQVVWRISKLPLSKKPVSSRFSTPATSRSKSYLLLGTLNLNLYDPTTNKEVVKNLKIQDQSQTLRNHFEDSLPIGSYRGYLVIRNRTDSSVNLIEISNDQLKPKIISLPPLHSDNDKRWARDVVRNVSVSSPNNGGDAIVAAKFYGSILSLCRVGDSEWTRIDVPYPSFEFSTVIYSERDERFYLNNGDRDYTGLIDLTPKSGLVTPPVIGYPFPINLDDYEKDLMGRPPYSMVREQLVESPSGQLFLVSWTLGYLNNRGKWVAEKAQKIVVYKQDEGEKEICPYSVTKDIGDLHIFIGANEPFCVSANDYPGLKPNSVYFASHCSGFGVWDLSSQTILYLDSDNLLSQPVPTVCWIPPTPTLTS